MIDLEKELNDSRIKNVHDINEEEFLYKLEMRVRHSKDDRRTMMASLMMVVFIMDAWGVAVSGVQWAVLLASQVAN